MLDPLPDTFEQAVAQLHYFQVRGITRIAFLNATDTSGGDATAAFNRALRLPPFRSVMVKVAEESYNPTDISVAAQIAKIRAAHAQAIISYNSGLPFGTVLLGMHDAGLNISIATTGGNMTYGQMKQYAAILPKDLVFTGLISWAPGELGPGSVRDAQLKYVGLLHKDGMRPEAGYATIWDPALLAVEAYRRLGINPSKQEMHAVFSRLRGFAGILAVYDFKKYPSAASAMTV